MEPINDTSYPTAHYTERPWIILPDGARARVYLRTTTSYARRRPRKLEEWLVFRPGETPDTLPAPTPIGRAPTRRDAVRAAVEELTAAGFVFVEDRLAETRTIEQP